MGDITVYGPIQGIYLCCLSEDLARQRPEIRAVGNGDGFSSSPSEPAISSFVATGKDRYFLFKTKDGSNKGLKLIKFIVNGVETGVEPGMDKNALFAFEEMFDKVHNPEEKILVQDMIDEVEFKVSRGLQNRAQLLTDIPRTAARNKRRAEVEALRLRTPSSGKSDRRLLRRYLSYESKVKPTKEGDIEEVKLILTEVIGEKDDPNMPVCFVLDATSLEATTISAQEFLKKNSSDISAIDYLKEFGLNGIPIVHDINNYTDPMNIGINGGVKEVAHGRAFCLNQSSLWYAASLNQVKSLSQHSDLKNNFTAIVPIKAWNNPKVWSSFRKTRLGKLGISAHLRGTATPLPNDQIALTCATLMATIKQWEHPKESQADLMVDLLDTIQFNKTLKQISAEQKFMKNPDEIIINEMSSELAPIAMMLECKELIKFAGSMKSGEMWRAVISNSVYWNVRRAGQGNETMKWKQEVVKDNLNFETKTVNKDLIKAFDIDTALYARTFAIAKKFNLMGHISPELFKNITTNTEDFEKFVAGYDFELFMAVEVVKAHLCIKSSWRWDKKGGKLNHKYPYFNRKEDAWKWLEKTIKNADKKEKERENKEANKQAKLIRFFDQCTEMPFSEFYIQLNENIPDEFNKFKVRNEKTKFCINEVYDRLTKENVIDLKDKLLLLLFGRNNYAEWNRGEFLRNDQIADNILKSLMPILEEKDLEDMPFNLQWLEEMETSLKDKFAKHWYRTKGSRKRYGNQKPSFWAITGYTDPWSFLKTDKEGYEKFKEKLSYLDHKEPSQQSFYSKWSHLVENNPTKENTTGKKNDLKSKKVSLKSTGSPVKSYPQRTKADLLEELNQKFVSIYPYPTDYSNGFNSLLKCLDISADSYEDTKENMAKVASNWKKVVECLIDKEEAGNLFHSIQEVFALNETSSMAFTAFNFVRKKLMNEDIPINKKDNLKALFKRITEDECPHRMETPHIFNPKGKERDEDFIIFERDHLNFLEELLPMRYIELKKAINFIYGKEHTKRMALTLHVLKRYADMKFTSMEAFKSLLAKKLEEDLTITQEEYKYEDLTITQEEYKYCEASVDFEMIFNTADENSDNIKDILNKVLHDVKTKDNLILWLNQAYERQYKKNSWKPLKNKVTKTELEPISVAVTEVWYGNFFHEMIHINFFNDERFETEDSISEEERERLTELKNFFHLALTHAYQIVPAVGAFNLNGTVYEVKRDLPTPKERAEKLVLTIRELWKGLETDDNMRDETASIFSTLGGLGIPYNRSEQILELLKSVEINEEGQEVTRFKEEDSLMISVEEIDNVHVGTVHCNRLFVWPDLERRLKDLPENEIVGKIRGILVEALVKSRPGLFEEIYDALVHEAIPGDLMSFGDVEDLMTEMRVMEKEPRGRITKILKAYSDNNGTLGGLVKGFSKLSKEYGAHYAGLEDAVSMISNDINSLTSTYYNQFRRQRSYLGVITTMDKFIDFLKDSNGNCATLQNHPYMTKTQLDEKIMRNEVKPGDQIWMLRKKPGLYYAHAGIYDATDTAKFLIHVQPRKHVVINKGGKVVCQDLKEAVHLNDKIFVVRCFKKRSEQEKILKNAFACVLPEKVKFNYNAYHGSCQTFCSKVCGVETLKEINPEMSFTDANWFKRQVATKFISNPGVSLELVNKLQEKLAHVPKCGPYENEDLMDVCNDPHHRSSA